MFDFDEIVPREGTNSVKFCDPKKVNAAATADAIPMWVADMDFRCAPNILEALHRRVDAGIFGYSSAEDAYYDALTKWYSGRYGLTIDKKDVVLTNGVVTAINHLVKLLSKEGEGIIIMTPSYGPFDRAVVGGRKALYNRLIYDGGRFGIDMEDLRRKAEEPSTTLFILCNPHNPTGRVWTREELEEMHRICSENGVRIISDEIHSDITRTGVDIVSMLDVAKEDPSVVVCTAPSKTFNMAGNGLSNIIVRDEELRNALSTAAHASVSPFSLTATEAAYRGGAEWVDEMRAYLDGNFRLLAECIEKNLPEITYVIPDSTYLAWVDMRFLGLTDEKLEELFASHGVLIEAGNSFVDNAEGFIRVNIACPRSVLEKGLARMLEAIRSVKA